MGLCLKSPQQEAGEVGGGKDGALDEQQLIDLVFKSCLFRGLNKIGKSYSVVQWLEEVVVQG